MNLCFSSCSFFRKNLGNHQIQLCEWGDLDSVSLGMAVQEMWCPPCTSATACPEFCHIDISDELRWSQHSSSWGSIHVSHLWKARPESKCRDSEPGRLLLPGGTYLRKKPSAAGQVMGRCLLTYQGLRPLILPTSGTIFDSVHIVVFTYFISHPHLILFWVKFAANFLLIYPWWGDCSSYLQVVRKCREDSGGTEGWNKRGESFCVFSTCCFSLHGCPGDA